MPKKSWAEVRTLKDQWRADPIWNLEDTEGFEEHYHELFDYRVYWEEIWRKDQRENLRNRASTLECSRATAEYIIFLEERIRKLETTVVQIKDTLVQKEDKK